MKQIVIDRAGHPVDFDIACALMDDELREEVFMRCLDFHDAQGIFDQYAELHEARYGLQFCL